jgi:hypothetical protein
VEWNIEKNNTFTVSTRSFLNDGGGQLDLNYLLEGIDRASIGNSEIEASAVTIEVGCWSSTSGKAIVDGLSLNSDSGNVLSCFASGKSNNRNGYADSSAIGAVGRRSGLGDVAADARNASVNFNGDQTISAFGHVSGDAKQIRINAFGAAFTEPESGANNYGWCVGIFTMEEDISDGSGGVVASAVVGNSTINILGAKSTWEITPHMTDLTPDGLFLTLTNEESEGGVPNSNKKSRTFALRNDFQIYVGRRVRSDHTFEPIDLTAETSNTVNIIGVVMKSITVSQESKLTSCRLTVDKDWRVNAYVAV